jgi:hypothetical protein
MEAQRYEAAELRRKKEIDMRKTQQRARKEQKRVGHQKYVCRVSAKEYLANLRKGAMGLLVSEGVLKDPLETMLQDQVVPWIYDQVLAFLQEDDSVDTNIGDLFKDGYETTSLKHHSIVNADHEKKEAERIEKERIQKEKDDAQEARRAERARKRREEQLKKLKEEIKTQFIDKGDQREHILT